MLSQLSVPLFLFSAAIIPFNGRSLNRDSRGAILRFGIQSDILHIVASHSTAWLHCASEMLLILKTQISDNECIWGSLSLTTGIESYDQLAATRAWATPRPPSPRSPSILWARAPRRFGPSLLSRELSSDMRDAKASHVNCASSLMYEVKCGSNV